MPTSKPSRTRTLIFGATGKLGSVLCRVLGEDYLIIRKSSSDFDVSDHDQVIQCVREEKPGLVINAAAFLGIDQCEHNPQKAYAVNTAFPGLLAELSVEHDFTMVHISTDAVFDGNKKDYYFETDCPNPINLYGLTKYGADCLICAIAQRYYIARIPLLFGANRKNNQFADKMLGRIRQGETSLRISNDIVTSPSYSFDVATAIKNMIVGNQPFGLYHVANEGAGSLYDFVKELALNINVSVDISGCSHTSFPSKGRKNTYTPLKSLHLPPMRSWQKALREYCGEFKPEKNHD